MSNQIENLLEMNVPAVLTFLHKGKVEHMGSKNTRDLLKSIPGVRLELEKDALALCKGDTDVAESMTKSL